MAGRLDSFSSCPRCLEPRARNSTKREHQELLRRFFDSAAPLLAAGGEVHVTLIREQELRYDACGAASAAGLERTGSVRFVS